MQCFNLEQMKSLDFATLSTQERQRWLQNAVVPRPIAFVSTLSAKGIPNLAPFSFFNVMSSQPPILVFSPALGGKTATPKDTLNNLKEIPECVINLVHFDIVQACSLSSSPYLPEINEFEKSGLTPLPSDIVKPARIAESKIQFECRIQNIIELGNLGGAGNLVLAEVLKMHVAEDLLTANETIDPMAMEWVARAGDNWYCRMVPNGYFEITKPISTIGIGFDGLPEFVKNHSALNHNTKAFLAGVSSLPDQERVEECFKNSKIPDNQEDMMHRLEFLIQQNQVETAWCLLLGFYNYYSGNSKK